MSQSPYAPPPDDTQPRRPAVNITDPDPTPPHGFPPVNPDLTPPDDEDDGSPGCLVWSLVMLVSLGLGLGVVMLAGLAGWSDGITVARANATATRDADINVQCQRIQLDLSTGNLGLVQRRFDDLMVVTPAPDCIAEYAPTATAVYLESLPTVTPTPTPTLPPSPTPTPEATEEAPIVQPTQADTVSGFNLEGLLQEARDFIEERDYRNAIDTLDAISAIDATFQKSVIDSLLFSALTTEARNLYRSGTKLAEANLLVTRAEEFGDVGELNYERFIAQLYLEAQAYRNVNYPLAIRTLQQIVVTQGLTNYLDAQAQLINQHIRYADALVQIGRAHV